MLDSAAASRRKRQQLDHLLTIAAPHERAMLAGIAILLLSVFAWALFGRIEHAVTVDGVLVEPGVRRDAVSAEPGQLLEFLAVPGDRVEAGDPIARQSVPELEREISALRDRVELLETEFAQGDGNGRPVSPLLDSARVALLQMEARRAARAVIVSQGGGEVMALHAAPGEYLFTGASVAQIRDASAGGEGQPVQAVLRVAPRMAQLIRPGMRASVDVAMPGGEALSFSGEVNSVSAGPLPRWLAALRPATAESMDRVDVTLHPAPEFSIPDGAACRVRIVLGRKPPVALLVSARS